MTNENQPTLPADLTDRIDDAVTAMLGASDALDYRATAEDDSMLHLIAESLYDRATALQNARSNC